MKHFLSLLSYHISIAGAARTQDPNCLNDSKTLNGGERWDGDRVGRELECSIRDRGGGRV
jgi:hypothetical protein